MKFLPLMGGWAFLAGYTVVMVVTYVVYAAWFRVPVPHVGTLDPDLLYWSGLHLAAFIPCWLLSAWAADRTISPRMQSVLGGGTSLMVGATLIIIEVTG